MSNAVVSLIFSCVIFILLFSSDGNVIGLPIFILSLPLFLCLITAIKVNDFFSLEKIDILYLLLLLPIFLISIYIDYSFLYSFWIVKAILSYYMLCFLLLSVSSEINSTEFNSKNMFFYLFILIFFAVGVLFSNGDRGSFIFGPNILYRVFGVLVILILMSCNSWDKIGRIFIASSVALIALIGLIKTGSRGAIPIILILTIASLHFIFRKINLKLMMFVSLLIFLIVIYYLYSSESFFVSSRLSNFDYEGNRSLALRINLWNDFGGNLYSWIISLGHSYEEFKLNYWEPDFPYPHNIFIELIYFYGFFGTLLSLLIFVSFLNLLISILKAEYDSYTSWGYIAIIIFLGALFSGNLSNNYMVISLLMILNKLRYKND